MQTKKSGKNLIAILLFVLFGVLSAVGIWKTIYFSADIDESYALTMAARIAGGECMMYEMWELHQMSAFLYAPFVALYKAVVGSLEGALIFVRICGLVIQALLSIFLYRTVRKDMPSWLSLAIAFAYFNFTPKHIASFEFSLLFYWAFMVLMLCLIRYMDTKHMRWIVVSAVAMSVIVLCYPTMVLLFGCVAAWLLIKKEKKAAGIMTLGCAVLGAAFVIALILQYGGIGVFSYIPNVLMDESHTQNLALHMYTHLQGIWEMLFVVLALMILVHVGRPVLDKKKEKGALFLGLLLIAEAVYAIVQFHTINDVNFMILYPVILQVFAVEWYAYASFEKDEKDKLYFQAVFPLTLVAVLSILLSSNVLTAYSMSYFMPGVLLGVWQIYRVYAKQDEKRRSYAWMAILLLVCVLVQLFAARILLVRFSSTQKKNIFETYYEVSHDVLKGVRLGDFDYIQYEAKTALLDKYVDEDDSFLYVGADMFLYTQLDGATIATGNTISTPAFGQQLMEYYEVHPEKIPTVMFVDREYGADFSQVLLSEPMKTFTETYFDTEQAVMEPAVTVYTRER